MALNFRTLVSLGPTSMPGAREMQWPSGIRGGMWTLEPSWAALHGKAAPKRPVAQRNGPRGSNDLMPMRLHGDKQLQADTQKLAVRNSAWRCYSDTRRRVIAEPTRAPCGKSPGAQGNEVGKAQNWSQEGRTGAQRPPGDDLVQPVWGGRGGACHHPSTPCGGGSWLHSRPGNPGTGRSATGSSARGDNSGKRARGWLTARPPSARRDEPPACPVSGEVGVDGARVSL